jgi:hypothetical protein
MSCALSAIESHVARATAPDQPEPAVYRKAQTLMLRSIVSATATVVKGLSNFTHPFLSRIMTAGLSMHTLRVTAAGNAVFEETDRSLAAVLSAIPARLSIPSLLQCTPQVLCVSPTIAYRYSNLLKEFWDALDRTTLVHHLNEVFSIGVLCLDYRRVYGKQVADNEFHPDVAIVDAMSQLCLKLTESELRNHILKLLDWKNINSGLDPTEITADVVAGFEGKSQYSRGVTFYRFMFSLANKLRALMCPCMALSWSDAADVLSAFPKIVAASKSKQAVVEDSELELQGSRKKHKSSKKPQADADDEDDVTHRRKTSVSNNTFEENGSLAEIKGQVHAILKTVRAVCNNDNSNFIDQVSRFAGREGLWQYSN